MIKYNIRVVEENKTVRLAYIPRAYQCVKSSDVIYYVVKATTTTTTQHNDCVVGGRVGVYSYWFPLNMLNKESPFPIELGRRSQE
jgi:hypothetical protein